MLHTKVLEALHSAHQGVTSMAARAEVCPGQVYQWTSEICVCNAKIAIEPRPLKPAPLHHLSLFQTTHFN